MNDGMGLSRNHKAEVRARHYVKNVSVPLTSVININTNASQMTIFNARITVNDESILKESQSGGLRFR